MRYLSLLPLVVKRLLSRLPLSLLLCTTMALTVAIAVSVPAFSNVLGVRLMWEEFSQSFVGRGVTRFYIRIIVHPRFGYPIGPSDAVEILDWLAYELQAALDVPVLTSSAELDSPEYELQPRPDDTTYTSEYLATVKVRHIPGLEEHIHTDQGIPFEDQVDPDHLNVWISPTFLDSLALQVGETYQLVNRNAEDELPISVRIAGTWVPNDAQDIFWHRPFQSRTYGIFLTTESQYNAHVATRLPEKARDITYHYAFDEGHVNLNRAESYLAEIEAFEENQLERLPGAWVVASPASRLLEGQSRRQSFSFILFGFSFLILSVLIYFIALLSAMQARFQEGENAMLVSRGTSRGQLLGLAAAESLVLTGVAAPLGILMGLGLTRMLGYADGFLSFTVREPLRVSLDIISWPPVIGIVAVNLGVRLYSAWRNGRRTIVVQGQRTSRLRALKTNSLSAIMRRLFLALLAVIVTGYAYYQLRQQGTLAIMNLDSFEAESDPLVLLAPTLFLLTVPLLALELFMLLMRLAGFLGTLLPGVASYLASRNLARDSSYHRITVYLLILCLGMGSFYASLAKSADRWLVDSEQYAHGADLTFPVGVSSDGLGNTQNPTSVAQIPSVPLDEYRAIDGVRDAARVARFETYAVGMTQPSYRPKVELLAVDRSDFASVAYFRSDYASEPLGTLMNQLALRPNAVLLPADLAEEFYVGPGDRIQLNVKLIGDTFVGLDFEVVSTFEYFPTLYPEGIPMAVTDLGALEARTTGILPYNVWLQLEPGADSDAVMTRVAQMGVRPGDADDLNLALSIENDRLERTGIFGLLSVCFLAGAVLAIANLLVSSSLMLRERAVGYAVLRAVGMGRSSVLKAVALESLGALSYGLIVGLGAGILCARLYVPYFPLTDQAGPPIPPFVPIIDEQRALWIAAAVGVALILAQGGVLLHMLRMQLFEALRMGERA
ncbi:MAG: FtsX-like permease family protein [Anaerolineae bacterium]